MVVVNAAILGLSGSGKTTFFTAIHEALQHSDFLTPLNLHSDPATTERLEEIRRITRPETTISKNSAAQSSSEACTAGLSHTYWDDLVELSFRGRYDKGDGQPHDAFELRFLDYHGTALTEAANPYIEKRVSRQISRAHDVLCFLDGHYAAALLRGESHGRDYFDKDMAPLWKILTTCGKPAHFVITKWDLVRNDGNLDDCREALRTIDGFTHAVRASHRINLRRKTTPSLIPVSTSENALIPVLSLLPTTLSTKIHCPNSGIKRRLFEQLPDSPLARHGIEQLFHRAPQWTAALLAGCAKLASRQRAHSTSDRLTRQAGRLRSLPTRSIYPVGVLADVALTFLRKNSQVEKPYSAEQQHEALEQAIRLAQLEIDRFRRQFPASHLADCPL